MKSTTITDGFGRSVCISDSSFVATSLSGILPIISRSRKLDYLKPALEAISSHLPKKRNSVYTAESMFLQRLFGLVGGYEDLADHEFLGKDQGFCAALGVERIAGQSNLCRFENKISGALIDDLNKALLNSFRLVNNKLGVLPKRKAGEFCLFLDVDSTHVDLHGDQENKSYNSHYQCNCLAPVLCYLHGWPIAVYGASGKQDARKVLEPRLENLLKEIKSAFPQYRIVLRADGGFNSNAIMNICQKMGCGYITGLAPNRRSIQIAETEGIKYPKKKAKACYTTKGFNQQTIGKLNYSARSWGKDEYRRVIARMYTNAKQQVDLRLIQVNIKHTGDKTRADYFGNLSRLTFEELYEETYCGRGQMEQLIREFKDECFGARASAKSFTTNCYRMILAMFCQLVFRVESFLRNLDNAIKMNCLWVMMPGMTIRKVRRDLVCVTAEICSSTKRLLLRLPSNLRQPEEFMRTMLRCVP